MAWVSPGPELWEWVFAKLSWDLYIRAHVITFHCKQELHLSLLGQELCVSVSVECKNDVTLCHVHSGFDVSLLTGVKSCHIVAELFWI